ncbi:exonuclease VIII [Citrobacter phage HCF1]|uniref:Exodeoxyribonuclease VIII n=1 Tax=Citrobacter phage HCF1 TaxID=2849700 RepID=A0ABX6D780_9CAUD|nr:exonuclease VIII [Citrobacter phage HCF1]
MSEFKVFTHDQLTNDEYHDPKSWAAEYVSGSSLAEIYFSCPQSGSLSHARKQKRLYSVRSHIPTFKLKSCLRRSTDAQQIQTRKSFGLTGTSGKTYPDLIKMMVWLIVEKIVDCGEDLNVLWLIEMIEECRARADGVKLVPAKDYDACVMMRRVLEGIPEHNACMNSPTAQRELSIFGTIGGVKVKVRLDHVDVVQDVTMNVKTGVDPDGFPIYESVTYPEAVVITDYKTTASANPKEFSRSAFDHGYYLKMALQHDLFMKAYPVRHDLLSFACTPEQLKIGRLQYMTVINQFAECQLVDKWHGYANNAPEVELDTPPWVLNQFKGFL